MDEAELTTRLIRAENELRDLKTAQPKGLDELTTYSASVNGLSTLKRYRITIKISDEYPPNPLIEIFPTWASALLPHGGNNFVNVDPGNSDTQRMFYRIAYSTVTDIADFSVYCRATSKIESMTAEEI